MHIREVLHCYFYCPSFLICQSQEWYDSPDACRYVQFDKEAKPDERIPPVEVVASPMIESQQQQQQQHILNVGMREIQDAIQDMNITKQVGAFHFCHRIGCVIFSLFCTTGSQESNISCI